jgi:hypothetical protein
VCRHVRERVGMKAREDEPAHMRMRGALTGVHSVEHGLAVRT